MEDAFQAEEERPLIPEGEYLAKCVNATWVRVGVHTPKGTSSRPLKVVLMFRILQGPHAGTEIRMFLNAPSKKVPSGSKLYKSWLVANDLRKPKRRERMSLTKFQDEDFLVRIVTVKPKFNNGSEMPEVFWYSRVDEILRKQISRLSVELTRWLEKEIASGTGDHDSVTDRA